MRLQALSADENINPPIIDQIIFAAERAKLTVKNRPLTAALWRLVVLNPIWLAANLVAAMIHGHVIPQNRRKLRS